MSASILIVDDESKFCETLARLLARDGHQAVACDSPQAAIEHLRQQHFDFLLTDLKMPGPLSGIDLIAHAKEIRPEIDAVMMTAYATAETAIEAMKLGALDYLIKPCSVADVRRIIETAQATRRSQRDDSDGAMEPAGGPTMEGKAEDKPHREQAPGEPVARSESMLTLIARATKVAQSDASVLIRGESGTGKEVLARYIHSRSRRSKKPLVIVNCGAIPETLIESELFGHVRGAFTGAVESRRGYFEAADQGTLFLDEIGELPLHLQVKLLRALQDGHVQRVGDSKPVRVDVRVLAATNRDLEQAVTAGTFRQDLYFRLNVIPLVLPPLRERPEDVEALAEHFLNRYAANSHRKLRLGAAARRLLLRYDYPGNVRELENAIEHACVMAEGEEIQPEDLPERIALFTGRSPQATGNSMAPAAAPGPMPHAGGYSQSDYQSYSPTTPFHAGTGPVHPQTLEATERQMILDALAANRFNLSRAAEYLGITRRTLGYRIRKHGLDRVVEEGKAREYPRRPPSPSE